MPKSKRSKLVTLSQTEKKGREIKEKVFDEVRKALDTYQYTWVFQLDNARTNFLQDIRKDWQGSKIILGRRKVLEKALGTTAEEEYKDNLYKLSNWTAKLKGSFGLLFTDEPPQVVRDYFDNYSRSDFARANIKSPISFTIPAGIVYSTGGRIPVEDDVPMTHSVEEMFRNKFKIPTRIKNGKIVLENEYKVCEEGETLDVRQALILKQFGIACSEFTVKLIGYYDVKESTAEKVAEDPALEETVEEENEMEDEDEE